jgi:hypothetical protein
MRRTFDGRPINVELTVGGGGGSEKRKEKIEAKNVENRTARRKMATEHKDRNLAEAAQGLAGDRGGVYRDNRIRKRTSRGGYNA